ncbi:helix-turn-helix transcriptional regulator [Oceanobacillus caeni]|uniref:helix-turn-helix domain-containing protein n=1 Tax=Oceanobacillus caeni TaxID=405946 RepID=UPI0021499A5A|nr:helix-turn-helix transcriptional regulator [Oceanobacillus caeni]MCR1833097.1 helix-turn-helix transcriptional regulator [Oceanobacillus caeni]
MVVKNNLRLLMAQHKMNIQDVSDRTGLSRKSISKLYHEISTQITFDVIEKLCNLFECEIGDLLYLDNETKNDISRK